VNAYAVAALRKVTSTAQGMGEKLSPTELADAGLGTIDQP
jgi:hypothetical protein